MTFPFIKKTRNSTVLEHPVKSSHVIDSDFSHRTCRFVLNCTCGASHETRYIDEALEWSAMHRELAPLVDQLDKTDVQHD
jgi:hypothetical protein